MKNRLLVLIFVFTVFLSGCGKKEPVVVGCITYSEDKSFSNGVKLRLNEFNEEKEEKDKIKLEIREIPKESSTDSAVNDLRNSGVDIIISELEENNDSIITEEFNVPVLASKDYTSENESVIKFSVSPDNEADCLADLIVNRLKLKTAAVMYNVDYDYSNELYESFKKSFDEKGGELVGEFKYSNAVLDFATYIRNFTAAKPQALLILDKGDKAAKIMQQAYLITPILPVFMGSTWWEDISESIVENEAVDGSYYLSCFSMDNPDPENQLFIKSYMEKYNSQPNDYSAYGYDMASVALQYIENMDEENALELFKYTDYKGTAGDYLLSGNSKAQRSICINTIIDGYGVLYEEKEIER